MGQALTALKLALAACTSSLLAPALAEHHLRHAQTACSCLERSLSEVVGKLRPSALDALGIEAAIQQLLSAWSERAGVETEFDAMGLDRPLPDEVRTTVYRLVQEALTNVARHARASHVAVVVQHSGDQVIVSVEDDGVGFDVTIPRSGHFGLLGMRERVALCDGVFHVESTPGNGVAIIARIPLRFGSPRAQSTFVAASYRETA